MADPIRVLATVTELVARDREAPGRILRLSGVALPILHAHQAIGLVAALAHAAAFYGTHRIVAVGGALAVRRGLVGGCSRVAAPMLRARLSIRFIAAHERAVTV